MLRIGYGEANNLPFDSSHVCEPGVLSTHSAKATLRETGSSLNSWHVSGCGRNAVVKRAGSSEKLTSAQPKVDYP